MENLNDVFEEFAAYFAGERDCDRPMAHSGLLKRGKLDYTVASLETVDEYLKYLHEYWHRQMGRGWDQEWVRGVMWSGAYAGEVIRRNAPRPYDWVAFDVFICAFPATTELLGSKKSLAVSPCRQRKFHAVHRQDAKVRCQQAGGRRAFLRHLRGPVPGSMTDQAATPWESMRGFWTTDYNNSLTLIRQTGASSIRVIRLLFPLPFKPLQALLEFFIDRIACS